MRRPRWFPRLRRSQEACPECGGSVRETYCEVCGYDLIQKTRGDAALQRPPA